MHIASCRPEGWRAACNRRDPLVQRARFTVGLDAGIVKEIIGIARTTRDRILQSVQVQLVQGIRTTMRTLDKAIAEATETHPYAPLLATLSPVPATPVNGAPPAWIAIDRPPSAIIVPSAGGSPPPADGSAVCPARRPIPGPVPERQRHGCDSGVGRSPVLMFPVAGPPAATARSPEAGT
ncbi:hypothetical protein ACWC5I_26760, partial [Kitasatospora sp. NPDC001574]